MVVFGVVVAVIVTILWVSRRRWAGRAGAMIRSWLKPLGKIRLYKVGLYSEIAILILWTLWVGRDYLDLNPAHWPMGHEFGSVVQSHVVWLNLLKCGECVFWNGFVRGGAPAFADIYGSLLYPLVLPFTLLFGVVNAAKLLLVVAMFGAGMAQWWLARLLKVGWVARLWAAGMGVAAGHLSGRMELGTFGLTLSVAACALVIPAALQVVRSPGRRSTAGLGLALGTALLAGQGYNQSGLLVAVLPVLAVFFFAGKEKRRVTLKYLAWGFFLAALLAAVFLLPTLRFLPHFTKISDPNFGSTQSIFYIPLNLVNSDLKLLDQTTLYPVNYPHLYVIYVGWAAVLLALPGLVVLFRRSRAEATFFSLGIVLLFAYSSALILKPLVSLGEWVSGIRHVSQVSALAVPLVLAFSTVGLDWLLRRAPATAGAIFPRLSRWVGVPLVVGIFLLSWIPVETFSHTFYQTISVDLRTLRAVLSYLSTPTTQIVNTPFGEHFWIVPALEMNLKLGSGIRPWEWKYRQLPKSSFDLQRIESEGDGLVVPFDLTLEQIVRRENEYAAVWAGTELVEACQADAVGGRIDVSCDIDSPGTLVVQENTWNGWQVFVDGRRVGLAQVEDWLAVKLPPGSHEIQFRYRPWDAPLGWGISWIGWGWIAALWFGAKRDIFETFLPLQRSGYVI